MLGVVIENIKKPPQLQRLDATFGRLALEIQAVYSIHKAELGDLLLTLTCIVCAVRNC